MKLYEPQVQLIRQTNMEGPSEYWLHAVSYCPKTNLRAVGHDPLPETAGNDGVYHVNLLIATDIDLPELDLVTPVTHTVYLGPAPFDEEEGMIKVDLRYVDRGEEKAAGATTLSSSSAKEKQVKPGGIFMLCPICLENKPFDL